MSETAEAPVALTPTEPDPTYYENRYPEPDDICRQGGKAGVEYCYVAGHNQRKFTDEKWSPIIGVPVLTIAGPAGTVDTVVVMGKGEPIKGADLDNGIRRWSVDIDLEEATGIPANPDSPIGEKRISNSPDPKTVNK